MKRPPDISITRLAIYLRFLEDYMRRKGEHSTINSEELARHLDMNPHQIRKDLSYFGKFGERGIGYRIKDLKEKLRFILGLDKKWNLCLCGMGNLGAALFAYKGFREMSLNISAIFDNDIKKIGRRIHGVQIYSIDSIKPVVKKLDIDIAVIAIPTISAQQVTDKLVYAGIKAILNFAPVNLDVPPHVKLRNVDLSTEFINLTYFISASTPKKP